MTLKRPIKELEEIRIRKPYLESTNEFAVPLVQALKKNDC
jgi:hypothetical protein